LTSLKPFLNFIDTLLALPGLDVAFVDEEDASLREAASPCLLIGFVSSMSDFLRHGSIHFPLYIYIHAPSIILSPGKATLGQRAG
jgi:hypothetical protein